MRGATVVHTGMTVWVCGVLRRALCPATERWGARIVPLLFLLLASCTGKSAQYDQEFELDFKDPSKRYSVEVEGETRDVKLGSRQVRVRIDGGSVTRVTVTAYDDGVVCGTTTIDFGAPSDGAAGDGYHYDVTIECSRDPLPGPDAGAPMPDAEPDAEPDTLPPPPPDAGPSAECQRYCGVMGDRCPQVYTASPDECLATCAAFDWIAGTPGAAANTVECRIAAATSPPVPEDPILNCYRAGPTGGRRCGSLCGNYCEIAARACPGLVPDVAACKARECPDPAAHESFRPDTGNTLECRIFWMGKAIEDDGKSCARLAAGAQDPVCHD
jgi:hypothetical protein